MGLYWEIALAVVLGYLFGNLVFAYILGRLVRKVDVRSLGDGNPGALNSIKSLGWPLAWATFFGDALKTAAPMLLAGYVFSWSWDICLYVGLGAVLGHCFPVWMGFRGGKGTASMVALLAVTDWRLALLVLVIMLGLAFGTDHGPIGAMVAYPSIPVLFWLFGRPGSEILAAALIALVLSIVQFPLLVKTLNGTLAPVSVSVLGRPKAG